jgi:hypothetical protein
MNVTQKAEKQHNKSKVRRKVTLTNGLAPNIRTEGLCNDERFAEASLFPLRNIALHILSSENRKTERLFVANALKQKLRVMSSNKFYSVFFQKRGALRCAHRSNERTDDDKQPHGKRKPSESRVVCPIESPKQRQKSGTGSEVKVVMTS